MNKRLVAIALWFYAGWAFGSLVATVLDVHALVGPAFGVLAASVVTFASPRVQPTPEQR